jgi:hypothetical protein
MCCLEIGWCDVDRGGIEVPLLCTGLVLEAGERNNCEGNDTALQKFEQLHG